MLNSVEVLVDLAVSFEKDPRKILMAMDHAQERNKSFYVKTKVSTFANFEVGRSIKKKKKKEKSTNLRFSNLL